MTKKQIKKASLTELLIALDKVNKELEEIKAGTHEETNRRIEELKKSLKQ